MKVRLFDFQEQILATLRARVLAARAFASSANPQAIAFSAPTGSGKTIILSALFEDILFGEAGFPAQPDAVILWVSDMPELNEQTRLKIEGKSDRIRTGRPQGGDPGGGGAGVGTAQRPHPDPPSGVDEHGGDVTLGRSGPALGRDGVTLADLLCGGRRAAGVAHPGGAGRERLGTGADPHQSAGHPGYD
jgi:hypothetical protein